MKISLPVRILLLHLAWTVVFTVGAGWWMIRTIGDSYSGYAAEWGDQVETIRIEKVLQPMAAEVARAMLAAEAPDVVPEVREATRREISQGLERVVRALDSVDSLFVLDRDRRIVYASAPELIDLAFQRPEFREMFASTEILRKVIGEGDDSRTWYVMPVFQQEDEAQTRQRIGSVAVVYRADADLLERVPALEPPSVDPIDVTVPLAAFVIAIALGGLGIFALSVAPVRRLERAVGEFRKRGFRGGIDAAGIGDRGRLAATVQAINELGGELEALDRRGREREVLLATLSFALEDGMIALGSDGAPKTWNRAAVRILCAREGGAEAGAGGDDPARAVEDGLARNPILVELAGDGGRASREIELRLVDGTTAPAKATCLPFESGPGEFGRLVLIRDLAALRRVETHLLESSRYAVLAHLAAGLAHEIRNPLHSIGINAGVVEQYAERDRDPRTQEAMAESLRSIQDETRRLTDLLNNYLDMVRPDQTPQPVDLRELARRVVQLVIYSARKNGVELELVEGSPVPAVHGSADRLQQAILNLVLNAVQAVPRGGRVAIETFAGRDGVRIRVSDTGPGVPPELRERLFSIRVTTKPGGSGLGLPLVRLIAENHGGSIRYDPREGGGSTFTLTLPVRAA